MNKHVKIFSETSIIIERLRYLLEEQNIATLIKDPINSGHLAGFGSFGNLVDLFVFESDYDKAIDIVKNFQKEIEQ